MRLAQPLLHILSPFVTEPMSLVEIGIVVTVGFDETGLSVKTLSWQVLDTLSRLFVDPH